jgi:predicted nuclease of restriction endonuclease-like RecB superfamily
MLTKDLLSYRVRAGRVQPRFLEESDAGALAMLGDLLPLFDDWRTRSVGELEELATALSPDPPGPGLRKILLDQLTADDEDETVVDLRWRALLAAEARRREGAAEDVARYQADVARDVLGASATHAELSARLYADLPARRRVRSYKAMNAVEVIRRYNCAQIQGLLLRARSVVIRLKSASLAEKRELFQQLRFHRLLAQVAEEGAKKTLALSLTGPLGIFDQAATYGLRLANFFPHLLHLSAWELEADVDVKNKTLVLKLDESAGLTSHYKRHVPFVPEELTAFLDAFNERYAPAWRATPGDDFVHVGNESYCFPDVTATPRKGHKVHVELFHRWHQGALAQRLQAAEKNAVTGLILGVSKNLAKKSPLAEQLAGSRWFDKFGFIFSEFPTPKALEAALARAAGAPRDL